MCILSYLPSEVKLNEEAVDGLWNGGLSNGDGHGWAIASDDGMIMGKSLDLTEALSDFIDARDRHIGPALFHSRWATHGSIRVNNCHPFMVGGSHQTVLAHNGILPKEAHPVEKDDDRSDTAILAEEILPRRYFRLDKPTVRRAMSQWCTPYNKVIVLTVNPRYRYRAYIINENQGYWDAPTGVWHSNKDYLTPYKWSRHWDDDKWDDKDDKAGYGPCYYCTQIVDSDGYCSWCRSCQDCEEEYNECQCWSLKGSRIAELSDLS